jgi:hypothetical protein
MTPDPTKFDEPALKAAVRRAWGKEQAPASLRQRIEGVIAQDSSDVIRVDPSIWRRRARLAAMSAAAVVLIGLGIFMRQMKEKSETPRGPVATAQALPPELGAQLISRHDTCTKAAPKNHHFFTAAPKNNYKAISQKMAVELHHPVAAASIGKEWDFRGASLCPVGETKSAHLIYASGDAFVSVFSLPATSVGESCGDSQMTEIAIDNHPIAGFVQGDAFYCIVASTGGKTPVDLNEIRTLRDRLRESVVARGLGNELLHVVATSR